MIIDTERIFLAFNDGDRCMSFEKLSDIINGKIPKKEFLGVEIQSKSLTQIYDGDDEDSDK